MKGLADIASFDDERLARVGADPREPTADEARAPDRVGGMTRDPRTIRRARARVMKRLARQTNAARQIERLPRKGEDLVMIMTGNFHGWDLVGAILQLAGEQTSIDYLRVATLGFNRTQSDELAELLDAGRIGAVSFMVSELFRDKNVAEFDYLAQVLRSRGQRIEANRNHAKLILVELSDGRKLALHGSLNLRRCNSWEQLVISHDAKLHDFFADWINEVLDTEAQP